MGNCQTSQKAPQRPDFCLPRKTPHDECLEIKFMTANEHSGFLLSGSGSSRCPPPAVIYAIDEAIDDQSTSTSAAADGITTDHCEDSSQVPEPPVMASSKCVSRRATTPSINRYKGETHQGKACGYGIFEDENGSRYEGFWKDNRAHGRGRYTRQDGSWYNGNWENNLQSGHGEEHWPDGSRYEGSYVRGLKTGHGKFVWADGSYYSGELKDNLAHGFGEHYWAEDARKYQGDWVQNKMHGWGRMEWADGSMFDGEFQDDRRHGYGRFVWPSGVSFVGFWESGLQHGRGVMIDAEGHRKRGCWSKGVNVRWEATDHESSNSAETGQVTGAPTSKIAFEEDSRRTPPSRDEGAGAKKGSSKSSGDGLGHFRSVSVETESVSSQLIADLMKSPAFSHLDSEFEEQ